jgi:hypothetical protein
MRSIARWGVRALVAIAVLTAAQSALADGTIDLNSLSGNPYTWGNFLVTFNPNSGGQTVRGCGYVISNTGFGTGIASGACTNDRITYSVHRGVLEIDYTYVSPSSSLASVYPGNDQLVGSTTETMYSNLKIALAGAGNTITNATISVSGTTTSGTSGLANITAVETANTHALSVNASSPTSATGGIGAPNFFAVQNVFSVTNSNGSGYTLSLITVTEKFYSTPEPLSVSLFGLAIVGLISVRRRTRAVVS